MGKLNRGNIHRNRPYRYFIIQFPLCYLSTGEPQDFHSERNNKSTVFRHRDKAVGEKQTEFRMLPAYQGLVTDHLHGFQAHLRLVVHYKFTISQSICEGLFQMELLHILEIERLVKEAVLAPACLFGRVHGGVGTAQEVFNGLSIPWANRDANAGAAVQFRAIELISRGQMPGYAVGPLFNIILSAIARQQDDELIASKTGRHIIGVQQALNPARNSLKQEVTHLMAQGIVD